MKRFGWYLLFACFFTSTLTAQLSPLGDSLYLRYEQAPSDSLKINYLLLLSWEAKNSSVDTAFHFINLAFELADSNNDSLAMAKSSYYKAVFHYYKGETAGLNEECAKAIVYYQDDVYGKASVYNLKGLMDMETGALEEALSSYLASLKLGEQTENLHAVANPYHNIGIVYEQLEDYDSALDNYLEALELRKEINDTAFIIQSWVAIGGAYFWKRDYDNAKAYLQQSLVMLDRHPDVWTRSKALLNLGLTLQETGEFPEALAVFRQAIALQEDLQDDFGLVKSYLNMAETHLSLEQARTAIPLGLKAVPLAIELESRNDLSKLYDILARAYASTRNFPAAYRYQEEYSMLKDSLLDEVKIKEISALQVQFETEKKEKKLILERQKNAEAKLKISQRNSQLMAVIGGALLILLLGGFFFYRNKQRQKNELAGLRIAEQRKGLKAVIQAQEEERKRIARDLHDGIVQQLGGLKLGFQRVFSSVKNEESDKLLAILDDSAQELRELSHEMMPRALSDVGLAPAIRDMLDNSLGNTDLDFSFEHFGTADRYPESTEITLYRIAQELVSNVIKHSGAGQVSVQLYQAGNDIILIVEDDGQGFFDNQEAKGIGLMNINSRLDTVDGTVHFDANSGKGTLATVKIPLRAPNP
jgi:signal transduction histidine kinase